MRVKIKALAKANARSMNSEIVFQLAAALRQQEPTTAGDSLEADPAAVSEQAALPGGAHVNQASGEPR